MTGIRLSGRAVAFAAGDIVPYMKSFFAGDFYIQIWYVPPAGGTPVQVTTETDDGTTSENPDLSPDASRIAFVQQTSLTDYALYVINVDGSGLFEVVPPTVSVGWPQWHPDGDRILYRSQAPHELRVVDADGSNDTLLFDATGSDALEHATWSPDGTQIAFQVNPLGSSQLWVMDADGSNATNLGDCLSGAGRALAWLSTSDVIVFVESVATNAHISKINADGTGKTQLTSASITPRLTRRGVGPGDVDVFVQKGTTTRIMYRVPLDGSGESAVSPSLDGSNTIGRGQPYLFNGRIYTIRNTTFDLVSILPDGSDLRVEDTPTVDEELAIGTSEL